jgi:uncharacterized protein YndB with AHSA1/START domain
MNTKKPVVARVTRRFTASPERVFDAFLDREKAGRFMFATDAGQMVKVEIEPRVGGRFVFVDRREGEDVEHTGQYLEIDRPRRLVFTLQVPKYSAQVTRVVIEITASSAGSELTLTHEMAADAADKKQRTEQGWAGILGGLAKTLEEPSSQFEVARAPGGGFAWQFERQLPHSPGRVFRALTDPAELADWFPFDIEGPREVGARLRFVARGGELPPEEGTLTELEPPRLIAFTWGEQAFRWEIEPTARGSRLLMVNTFSEEMKAERDVHGWEHCHAGLAGQLDALEHYLATRP